MSRGAKTATLFLWRLIDVVRLIFFRKLFLHPAVNIQVPHITIIDEKNIIDCHSQSSIFLGGSRFIELRGKGRRGHPPPANRRCSSARLGAGTWASPSSRRTFPPGTPPTDASGACRVRSDNRYHVPRTRPLLPARQKLVDIPLRSSYSPLCSTFFPISTGIDGSATLAGRRAFNRAGGDRFPR